jgi:DNA-binding NtrC family response regulator
LALTRYVHTICNPKNYPLFNFEIKSFKNAHEYLENSDDDADIMILDYYLLNEEEPDVLTGEDVVVEVKKTNPKCKIIMVTEQQDPSVAVQLNRLGVAEYIDKNISNRDRLGSILQKLLTEEQLKLKQ